MAYIEVRSPNGEVSIGSSFHIGNGLFVTARHVVENNAILSMATTESHYVEDPNGSIIHGDKSLRRVAEGVALEILGDILFPENPLVDVAVLVTSATNIPFVPLGLHFDDWINDSEFLLANVLILGYPPIPLAQRPVLVAATGEVNAVVDKYTTPHVHFITSIRPRGGFSGGLCLVKWEFALGLVVESLVMNNQNVESGFMAVLSVEPIITLLDDHNLLPDFQKTHI